MDRFASTFGLAEADERTVKIAKIYTGLRALDILSLTMSMGFLWIFIADALGGGFGQFIEGMTLLGVLIVINMATHTILDYPTGAIGDWIGQRYLLATAFFTYAVSLYMLSLVNTETPFLYLVVLMALMGFGGAQESGALEAWFDSNYRVSAADDIGGERYGVFYGKANMVFYILDAIVLIPGGLLATLTGRTWVFQLQSVLCIVIALSCLKFVQDLPETKAAKEDSMTLSQYYSLLKGGIGYVFSSPFVKYFLLGMMLIASSTLVWGGLIIFPLLYSYLILDFAVASVRTLIRVPGPFIAERSGVWAKRFDPRKWIPRFRIIQTCGFVFYLIFALIVFILPPIPIGTSASLLEYTFPFTDIVILSIPAESLLPIILMMIMFVVTGVFSDISNVLTQRVLLEVVPNRVRNGVYSLFPTIMLLFAMPQIIFFGWVIAEYGIPLALILCSIVTLAGTFLMHKGLTFPMPEPEDVSAEAISEGIPEEFEATFEEELTDAPTDEFSDESNL